LEVPAAVSTTIGIDGEETVLDLQGTFSTDGPARHWEYEWPTIQHKLAVNPVRASRRVLSARDARDVDPRRAEHARAPLRTHEETLRLLALALHLIGG